MRATTGLGVVVTFAPSSVEVGWLDGPALVHIACDPARHRWAATRLATLGGLSDEAAETWVPILVSSDQREIAEFVRDACELHRIFQEAA